MALTDIQIRNARAGLKPIKLGDEKGLFLLLQPSGGKLWRLKYRIDGKEKKLSLGRYPETSLRVARQRRDEARTLLDTGIDPGEFRKAQAQNAAVAAENTFSVMAEGYLNQAALKRCSQVTIAKSRWLISKMSGILPLPIGTIKPRDLIVELRKVEAAGHLESARRMLSLMSRIFRYAVQESVIELDITPSLRNLLSAPKVKHHGAVIEAGKVGQLLRAIDDYQGNPSTAIALKLSAHIYVRPGELRHAEWCEVDLDEAIWTIPAKKMKMREPHFVPLSRQSVELFRQAAELGEKTGYVFSSLYGGWRPMSENTINAALRRLGYSGEEMTAHGFRSTASTLLNESKKWSADAIERALAHTDRSTTRSSYHRGPHWDERILMAQWWSDYLDALSIEQVFTKNLLPMNWPKPPTGPLENDVQNRAQ